MKKKLLTTCLHSSILQKLKYYYLIFVFTKYLIFDTILPQIFIFLASTHLRARIFGAIFINQAVKKLNSIHKIDNVNSQPVFERNIFLQFNRIFWIFSTLNWILIKKKNCFLKIFIKTTYHLGWIHLLLTVDCSFKKFFVFHLNSMTPSKVLVHIDSYNLNNFHWIQMKNKKFFNDTFSRRSVR